MRAFTDINPLVLFIYFICISMIPMLSMDVIFLALSLFGSVSLYLCINKGENKSVHFFSFALLLVMTAINPVFSHRGSTVIFVVNDAPITLESILYGFCASVMIISVLYWFRSFSSIMTSDKIIYIFGGVSPKLALIISMSLRYIPLFKRQITKINHSQKALGLYSEENIVDTVKGKIRIFSIMVTWTIENGIITAESMEARGYGIGRRSRFSHYRITLSDVLFAILFLSLAFISIYFSKFTNIAFYPNFEFKPLPISKISYIAYGTAVFLPTVIEIKENLKWKYLERKI